MYLRTVKARGPGGVEYECLRLVEAYWEDGHSKQRIIANLGRNTRWGLEQTQVATKREVQEDEDEDEDEDEVYDPLSMLSDEELAQIRRKVEDLIRSGELACKARRRRGPARRARRNEV